MKRIFIISGRYILENPYRELQLKSHFEALGFEVIFGMPGRKLNANGYTEEAKEDRVYWDAGAVWLETEQDYRRWLRICDGVLFGSWKSYDQLAEIAGSEGKPVVNCNTTSGLDHWPQNVDYALVKSSFMKRVVLYLQKKLPRYGTLRESHIVVTGSIIHEHYKGRAIFDPSIRDRTTFCERYNLDPNRPVVVLFPKGIGSFHKKTEAWFPDWDNSKREHYNKKMMDKYASICNAVKNANCNLIIKMHPSAYTSYMSRKDDEYAYWSQFLWARVLIPQHTYACYLYGDCGLGILTHSALDMGYFNKPFIYVDSHEIEKPSAPPFHLNHLCALPPGPSSHWHQTDGAKPVNPWFPSWLGYYSSVDELPEILNEKIQNPIPEEDRKRFINEFWYKDDGLNSARIAEFVANYLEQWGLRRKIYTIAHYGANLAQKEIVSIPARVEGKVRKGIEKILSLR